MSQKLKPTVLKRYRLGFDIWGLVLFLLVMLPNCIWFALPAGNDVLKAASRTPGIDLVASVCQALTIGCLCCVVKKVRKPLRLSPLVIATMGCVVVYYAGWVMYYLGVRGNGVVLLLAMAPCAALILFATDRENVPAMLSGIGFAICHLFFCIANFINL